MMCSTCNKEAANGRVVRQQFICKACQAAERTEKRARHEDAMEFFSVRFKSMMPLSDAYTMTRATYKKNDRFWTKIKADEDWWGDNKIDTKWNPDRMPGQLTQVAAIAEAHRNALERVARAEKRLKGDKDSLDALKAFAVSHGVDLAAEAPDGDN